MYLLSAFNTFFSPIYRTPLVLQQEILVTSAKIQEFVQPLVLLRAGHNWSSFTYITWTLTTNWTRMDQLFPNQSNQSYDLDWSWQLPFLTPHNGALVVGPVYF